jgi:hypothetical protein
MAEYRQACQHHEPAVRETPPETHCHAADGAQCRLAILPR